MVIVDRRRGTGLRASRQLLPGCGVNRAKKIRGIEIILREPRVRIRDGSGDIQAPQEQRTGEIELGSSRPGSVGVPYADVATWQVAPDLRLIPLIVKHVE